MPLKESDLVLAVRELSAGNVRLFRNNVGTLQDMRGNYVHYGLAVGSSDLIGWRTHVIVPRDVGSEVAIFTAIECKTRKGLVTPAQAAVIKTGTQAGGV